MADIKVLCFRLDERETPPDNLEEVKALLARAGITLNYLKYDDDRRYLTLAVPEDVPRKRYIREKLGRCPQLARLADQSNDWVTWSDVVYMEQTMTDQVIMQKLRVTAKRKETSEFTGNSSMTEDEVPMAPATYYRKKRKMKESDWYKELDPEKLGDLEYLRSVPGDNFF